MISQSILVAHFLSSAINLKSFQTLNFNPLSYSQYSIDDYHYIICCCVCLLLVNDVCLYYFELFFKFHREIHEGAKILLDHFHRLLGH